MGGKRALFSWVAKELEAKELEAKKLEAKELEAKELEAKELGGKRPGWQKWWAAKECLFTVGGK